MNAKDFPALCINTKYLTPSTQEIRGHRGRVQFEGRYYTYFSRLETFFQRQWQKILRIFHLIKKDTQLNNNDVINVIKNYTDQIQSNIDKIDPLTLQPHVETARKKIAILSKCLSNKTEKLRKDQLLAKCDALDLALRKKRALAAAQRAKKAAEKAEKSAAKAAEAEGLAAKAVSQIEQHQGPAAIIIQRAFRQYLANKKAAQKANAPSFLSTVSEVGWNVLKGITAVPKTMLMKAAEQAGHFISPELGQAVSNTVMACGVVSGVKEICSAVKDVKDGKPATATLRLANLATQTLLNVAPMVSPEFAEAKRLAKEQALIDKALQN